jgi:hypothetical protein
MPISVAPEAHSSNREPGDFCASGGLVLGTPVPR